MKVSFPITFPLSREGPAMRTRRTTFIGLFAATALLAAACGAPDAADIAERAVEAIERAQEVDEAPRDSGEASDLDQFPGRDTTLPIYPGAVRVNFSELSETGALVIYLTDDPLDAVIEFYVREIGGMGGLFHSEFVMGDGDYEFAYGLDDDFPLDGYPGHNSTFVVTLEAVKEGSVGTTEIRVMGTVDFFE